MKSRNPRSSINSVITFVILAFAVGANTATAQEFFLETSYDLRQVAVSELDFLSEVAGPIPSAPFTTLATVTGVGLADVTGNPESELLFHDNGTITWWDPNTGGRGTLLPAVPGPIVALVGLQVGGGARQELIVSSGPALWVIDFEAPPLTWIGPVFLPWTAQSLAAANVLGGPEDDLIATDGVNVYANDVINNPATWVTLQQPAGSVDSLTAVDFSENYPGVVPSTRHLTANVGGRDVYLYDPAAAAWVFVLDHRFGIASSTPLYPGATPPLVANALVALPPPPSTITLTDIAPAAGIFSGTAAPGGDIHCPGAVTSDLNGDSFPDLYLCRGNGAQASQENQMFLGDGLGGFSEITGPSFANDAGNGAGALAFDYDNDGRRDLFVINMDGDNALYQQQSDSTFQDVTASTDPTPNDPVGDLQEGLRAGIPDLAGGGHCPPSQPTCELNDSLAAAAGDFNRDGLLDLYVGNHLCCSFTEGERDVLYLQDAAGGTFTDITLSANITTANLRHGSTQAVIVGDFNNDRWPDIYVGNKGDGPSDDKLYLNDGGTGGAWSGTFSEWFSTQAPPLGAVTLAAMGLDAGDFDNDGDLDIYLSDGGKMDLYENLFVDNGGVFGLQLPATNPLEAPWWGWGTSWLELDNDGDLDLHLSTNQEVMNYLFRNDGSGTFAEIAYAVGAGLILDSRASVPVDFDRDGREDLLVVDRGSEISLLRNDTVTGNHWLQIELRGNPLLPPTPSAPYTTSRDAIGARVAVTAGGVTQRRDVTAGGITCASTEDYTLTIGLGSATTAALQIFWPSGRTSSVALLGVDRRVVIREQ